MSAIDEILDLKEAARYLNIKERTLYRLANEGEIPGKKIGGQWRFSKRCLEELSWRRKKEEFFKRKRP